MTALDEQVGGDHYRNKLIQPWLFNILNKLPPTEAHIVEYACRWREKGGIQDLQKIQQYCQMLIDQELKVESVKASGVCESCFDKHLLAKTFGFEFLNCDCKCHKDACPSEDSEYKFRIDLLTADYSAEKITKEKGCVYCYILCPEKCKCKCHQEAKDEAI